jgi:sphingomyelin phosphodiesterase acid-like 3
MTRTIAILTLLLTALCLPAQKQHTHVPRTVPALMLSDIHFEPFYDPVKTVQIFSAPINRWSAILDSAPTPTREKDFATLNDVCHSRGLDTSEVLWRSTLRAMQVHATTATFVTVSGDLLAHEFECKFKRTFPTASDQDYVLFTANTIRYLVRGLQSAFPARPLYVSMGNNDSGCGDYREDRNSAFLNKVAKIVTASLPPDDREENLRDFAIGGYYNAPLPREIPHARILVLDDLFSSYKYTSCNNKPGEYASNQQIAWLRSELADAREKKQVVWVMAHIPPGIDLYRTLGKGYVCGKTQSANFFANEKLGAVLAANDDIIRLAVFAHTHTDELRLINEDSQPADGSEQGKPGTPVGPGVAVKLIASISPVNGNKASFTVARIDPATATMIDYTVFAASNLTGQNATWSKEYTFSETYHQPSFTPATLKLMTDAFRNDLTASTPESNAYLRNLYVGDRAPILKPFWPEYTCALTHNSGQGFADCVCKK